MQVAVRVQHHPSRAHLLPRLERALGPFPIEVVEHSSSPPNPWAGYQCCLTDVPPCTHLLVIQDDALPTPGFHAAVRDVAEMHPRTLVSLFLGERPLRFVRQARRMNGSRYLRVRCTGSEFFPVVATLWPRGLIPQFLDWAAESPIVNGRHEQRSDDAVLGRFLTKHRLEAVITVPSLVEHDWTVPSVKWATPKKNPPAVSRAVLLADGTEDWLRPV